MTRLAISVRLTRSASPWTSCATPLGMPASASARNSSGRDAGSFLRRPRDDRAAGGERGGDLLGEQIDREIPRREGRGRADRLADDPRALARRADQRAAVVALDLLGVPIEQLGRARALRPWPRRGSCPAPGSCRGDHVDPLAHQGRGLVEDRAALLDVGRAPFGPGAVRRLRAPRRGRPGSRRAPRRSCSPVTGLTTVWCVAALAARQTAVDEELEVGFVSHAAQIGAALKRFNGRLGVTDKGESNR